MNYEAYKSQFYVMSVLISLGHFLHACLCCMFLCELQRHRAYTMFIIVRYVYDREIMTIILIYQDYLIVKFSFIFVAV